MSLLLPEPIATRVNFDITIAIYLDTDVWTVQVAGREASVTYLGVRMSEGHLWVTEPKGVFRRANGIWAAAERNLIGVLPRLDGRKAWDAVPDHVKGAIQAAYAEQVAQLPTALPIP